MKKKVCVTTWYNSINYGTCIQCYALVEFLRTNNFNVYVPDSYKCYYGIKHPIETIKEVHKKFKKKFIKQSNDKDTLMNERIKNNTNFANKKIKINIIKSRKDYIDIINKCDFFISGSDQIWNPNYVTPPMLLSYVPKNKTKIAYGSSFGVSTLPKSMTFFYKKYLKKFDFIGVREKTAKDIVKSLINKEAEGVLDPSFLLNKAEWKSIAKKPKDIKEGEKFVFSYFIGKNLKSKHEIEKFSKSNNLPVYNAVSESKILDLYGTSMKDIGVEEFIWCILNAQYIITDSFHAVALSINFNKKFYVYKRFKDSDTKSQNSRIYDILKTFNIKLNIETKENNLSNIKKDINYKEINQVLETLRKSSVNFLLNALGGIQDE